MKTRTTLVLRAILALSLGIAFLAMNTVGTPTADADLSRARMNACTVKAIYRDGTEKPIGSGFFLDSTTVITNRHVVTYHENQKGYAVTRYEVKACDSNTWYRVNSTGRIPKNDADLAVLKLESSVPGKSLSIAPDGSRKTGQQIYAIGTPLGQMEVECSVTDGVISHERRRDGWRTFQHSAHIVKGNSGGPVLYSRGEVVGVNFASWGLKNLEVLSNLHLSFSVASEEIPGAISGQEKSLPLPKENLSTMAILGYSLMLTRTGYSDAALSAIRPLEQSNSNYLRALAELVNAEIFSVRAPGWAITELSR